MMKKQSKYLKTYLILGFILMILLTHLPVIYTFFYHSLTGAPTAVDGSMDVMKLSPAQTCSGLLV